MPSFQPGTRVLARLVTKKHIWRIAKVVEPDPNEDPDVVTVSYVGKTGKVKLPSKDVKLALDSRNPAPTVDLTDDSDHPNPKQSAQVQPTNPLPSFSDPWNGDSQAPSTASPSETVQQTSPIRAFSGPWSTTPHAQAHNPLNLQQYPAESAKQSYRDWLLAENPAERDHNPPAPRSKVQFPPPQRQPQVVSDPSFSASQYPVHSRGNLEPPSWDALHELPAGEDPAFHSQRDREENFDPYEQKAHPQSFQFTRIRADAKTDSQALRSPLSAGPSPPGQASHRPPIPRAFSGDVHRPTSGAWTTTINSLSRPARSQGSSKPVSPIPLRNGFTSLHHERHPLRSVDEDLRVPRAAIAYKDIARVPRHPQSSFDDDVPIPRNAITPRYVRNAVVQDGSDIDSANRFYPASKRQRLRYDMLTRDQMPPSFQPESALRKHSRRLEKREKENGSSHMEISREDVSHSLAYQRPLARENGTIRIAPGFHSSTVFTGSLETISDEESKVLEGIFADLSVNTDDLVLDRDDALLLRMRKKLSSLAVRAGGRKKSHPKKWSSSHYGKKPVATACAVFNFFECGVESTSVQGQVMAPLGDGPPASSLTEQEDAEFCPIPRVYGCSCQLESETHRRIRDERSAVQCCRCMLWSHILCTGLEPNELRAFREGAGNGKGRYVCMQCVDEHVALRSADHSPQHQVFDGGAKWISSLHSVSELMSGLSIDASDTLMHSNLEDNRSDRGCAWIREPLAKDEISARVKNLEQLREGVANASVGTRERILFDELLLRDRPCKPEDC